MLSRHVSLHRRIFIVATLAGAAVCCRDATEPNESLVFIKQPSTSIAGEPIDPPVEVMVRDASGRAISGTVTVALDPNPCGWHLAGTRTQQVSDTTAVFADLALDKVGRGYTLRASRDGLNVTSAPFDIRSGVLTEPLVLENVLCAKPNPQADGESLTYVPEDDSFWIADDIRNSIYGIDRRLATYGSQVTVEAILEALPDAAQCDDGDGNPDTTCSYVAEFELVAYDPAGHLMYVINTVNMVASDKPAIFRLSKGACSGCFTPESWQPLPLGPSYRSIIVVSGQIYLALGGSLYAYDYDTNELATVDADGDSLPPAYATTSSMVSLSFDGTYLWILTHSRELLQVEWATRVEHQRYELDGFGFSLPRGLEVLSDTVYILEGDAPNPIYVLSQRQP